MRPEDFRKNIEPYIKRGELCILWGKPTVDMDRDELMGFVGFLDELWEHRHQVIKQEQKSKGE